MKYVDTTKKWKRWLVLLVSSIMLTYLVACSSETSISTSDEATLDEDVNTEEITDSEEGSSESNDVSNSSNTESSDGTLNSEEGEFTYTIDTAQISEEGIVVDFPQLSDSGDLDKAEAINELIDSDIQSYIDSQLENAKDLGALSLELTYEITQYPGKILSITYIGSSFIENAPYPVNAIHTLNISIADVYRIPLNELFDINDAFVEQFKLGMYAPTSEDINLEESGVNLYELIAEQYDNQMLMDMLLQNETNYKMTMEGVIISIEMPHTFGDHLEMAIPLQAIEPNMYDMNPLWDTYLFTTADSDFDISNAGFQWGIYENPIYGYSLSYPMIYGQLLESDSGDGVTMTSTDGLYSLTIWAAYNIDESTGTSLLEGAKSRVAYITEEYSDENFYSLAYEGGGNETALRFVESGYVTSDLAVFYILSYPLDEVSSFTDVILRMDTELIH